jgi:hypothetical protein
MIDSLVSWLSSRIEQHTGLGVQLPTDSIEQPSVGIDLLGIFLFEHQDDLDRDLCFSSAPYPGALQLTKLFGSPGCGWTS